MIHGEKQLRDLLNASEDQRVARGFYSRQDLLDSLSKIVTTAGEAQPGDLIEVLDLDQTTGTGRTYVVLHTENEFRKPEYVRARQHSNPDRLTVDIHNNCRVKVLNTGIN